MRVYMMEKSRGGEGEGRGRGGEGRGRGGEGRGRASFTSKEGQTVSWEQQKYNESLEMQDIDRQRLASPSFQQYWTLVLSAACRCWKTSATTSSDFPAASSSSLGSSFPKGRGSTVPCSVRWVSAEAL